MIIKTLYILSTFIIVSGSIIFCADAQINHATNNIIALENRLPFNCEINIETRWKVYDSEYDIFIPYLGNAANKKTAFFQIDIKEKKQYLKIIAHPNTAIFINQQLIYVFDSDEKKKIIKLSDYFLDDSKSILVSLFHKNLFHNQIQTCLGEFSKKNNTDNSIVNQENNQFANEKNNIYARKIGDFKPFAIVVSIVIILLLVTYSDMYKSISNYYFNYQDIISTRIKKNDPILSRLNNSNHHLFLLILSMIIALLYILCFESHTRASLIYETGKSTVENQNFLEYLSQWITYSFGAYFIILLKIVSIWLVSYLFDLKNISRIYTFEFFRMSFFIYLLTFIITLTTFLWHYDPSENNFSFIIAGIYILALTRIIILGYKLKRLSSKHQLFLYLYICVIDILPYLVSMKVFLVI